MPPRRQTTVFDVSSLRLHPDGTRVDQVETNLRYANHTGAIRDAHGNWIARDAGGAVKVKRRIRVREPSEEDEGEDAGGSQEKQPTKRAAKRQKFNHDYSFLDALELANVSQTGLDLEPGSLPPPSSDLLKCIHYIASSYYSERGLLLNVGKKYRASRRQRRLERQAEGHHDEELSGTSSDDQADKDDDEGSSSESDEEEEQVEEAPTRRPHRRVYAPGERKPETKDMYRIMDGSALMAMGILVQEYVAHLLTPKIPDGWQEDDVEQADDALEEEQEGEEEEPAASNDQVEEDDV